MPGAGSAILIEVIFFNFALLVQTLFCIASNISFYGDNVFCFCYINCMLAASFDKEAPDKH